MFNPCLPCHVRGNPCLPLTWHGKQGLAIKSKRIEIISCQLTNGLTWYKIKQPSPWLLHTRGIVDIWTADLFL